MNFIAPCLSSSVSSSKPSADGYDVHNLVSGSKGFMGAYFIRPPVDISVIFPVPIDISCIKIVARLEQKCSTGFSVFTEPEDISSCQPQKAACSSQVLSPSDPSTSHHGLSSAVNASSEDSYKPPVTAPDGDNHMSEIYFCVGKFYTKNEDELVLKNYHYRHWLRLPMPDANSSVKTQSVFHGSLRHPNRKALKCVKSIILRIQSTAESGPPVLHSLEVWGQPGITTNKSKRKELLKQWTTYKPITKVKPDLPWLYDSNPDERKVEKSCSEDLSNRVTLKELLEVPEDFLDPLTCDIMTVPLLLPSGNSIDAHTLERFIASEATWGRPASDPFTGVPFRGDKQPVPNVALKARIDRFLLTNWEHPDIEKCGRTVGSSLCSSQAAHNVSSVSNKRVCEEYSGPGEVSDPDNKRKSIRVETDTVAPVEGSDAQDDTRNNSFDDLNMEIEAALKGKPKYLPTQIQKQKQNKEETGRVSLSTGSQGFKVRSEVLRAQTIKNKRDAITRPGQCLSGPESSSSNHHGIVQMIGGILSVTQGRTARAKRLPAHHVNETPSHLIRGDKPTQDYTYSFTQSVSCSCGETEALYKLDCEHLLCRKCLLKKQSNKAEVECGICKRTSKRSSISKYHMKSIFST